MVQRAGYKFSFIPIARADLPPRGACLGVTSLPPWPGLSRPEISNAPRNPPSVDILSVPAYKLAVSPSAKRFSSVRFVHLSTTRSASTPDEFFTRSDAPPLLPPTRFPAWHFGRGRAPCCLCASFQTTTMEG